MLGGFRSAISFPIFISGAGANAFDGLYFSSFDRFPRRDEGASKKRKREKKGDKKRKER